MAKKKSNGGAPEKGGVKARVLEARPSEAGRGLARLDPDLMTRLGVQTGDIIVLAGKKRTAARVWSPLAEDRGRGVVRIDGILRYNAGVGTEEPVTLRPAKTAPAAAITLAPTEPLRIVGGEQFLLSALEDRPVARGDLLPLAIMGRRVDLVVTAVRPPTADAVIV